MPARLTWRGFLRISLISIPVKVFPATESALTIGFNQLHGECQTRFARSAGVTPVSGRWNTERSSRATNSNADAMWWSPMTTSRRFVSKRHASSTASQRFDSAATTNTCGRRRIPEAAIRALLQGTVLIDVQIDESGGVGDTRLRTRIPLLDTPAIEAARQ